MRALLALLCAASAFAQVSHVTWTVTGETDGGKALLRAASAFARVSPSTWTFPGKPDGGKALLRAAGKVDSGWHLFSAFPPAGIPTSFQVAGAGEVRIFQPAPVRAFDKNFGADTETFE